MFYPISVEQGLTVLICGLCMGGSWPACRQVVKHVDFVSFNLLFVPAMSFGGLAILSVLSLPHPRSPPPPPRGPGDYLSLMEALLDQTELKTSRSLFMCAVAGACVATSNFMLSCAMQNAGLTRTLPVFNGMAIVVGVSVNYMIEGNKHPASLVGGVLAIFGAILLTFLSRQLQEQEPDLTILEAEASLREKKLSHRSRHSGGALSFGSLSGLLHKVEQGDESALTASQHEILGDKSLSKSERGRLHDEALSTSGYAAVATSSSSIGIGGGAGTGGGAGGGAAARPEERDAAVAAMEVEGVSAGSEVAPPEKEGNVLLGLLLSGMAGCIDGCWSSLTLTAKLSGVDNYVAASYFCLGLLVPLVVLETAMYLRNPTEWKGNLAKVTFSDWFFVALSGFLNIAAIITYFMATVIISSAVAFAIFLSTPLVSIALGAFVLRELDDEPLNKKILLASIIALYVVAICTLASNALAK